MIIQLKWWNGNELHKEPAIRINGGVKKSEIFEIINECKDSKNLDVEVFYNKIRKIGYGVKTVRIEEFNFEL